MDFPLLDGLRMWKSAILLFVFVSLGKFFETWRNTALIALPPLSENEKEDRKIYVMCAVLFLLARWEWRANSGLLSPFSFSFWSTITKRFWALEKSSESAQKRRLKDGFLTRIRNECGFRFGVLFFLFLFFLLLRGRRRKTIISYIIGFSTHILLPYPCTLRKLDGIFS